MLYSFKGITKSQIRKREIAYLLANCDNDPIHKVRLVCVMEEVESCTETER